MRQKPMTLSDDAEKRVRDWREMSRICHPGTGRHVHGSKAVLHFVSEASAYRLLKAHDLISSPIRQQRQTSCGRRTSRI
jgi:hypothetical protein